jgi:hypothetical protein
MTQQLPELKVSCTDSRCDENLHCFRPRRSNGDSRPVCRECGADLVDWEELYKRDIDKEALLFSELPKELIRHHYWHMRLPDEVIAKALRASPHTLAKRTKRAVSKRVAAPSSELWRDGAQTPSAHSVGAQIYFCGMHAVAACCRKCMEYWHGIPREQPLSEEDALYFQTLVWHYVCLRLDHHEWFGVIDEIH